MTERLIGHWTVLMEDTQRPIHSLFHHDIRRLQAVLDLVELAAVGHGPISPEHPPGLQGKHRPHVRAGRQGRCRSVVCAGCTAKRRLYRASQGGKNRFASARVAMPREAVT